jgi:hypothetical protein
VMLTIARFLLEKTGGDSMAEVTETLARWRERLGRVPAGDGAGVNAGAGVQTESGPAETRDASEQAAGLFGSGGDD